VAKPGGRRSERSRPCGAPGQRRDEGTIPGWYEGSHGQRDRHYGGEAAAYGEEVWELVARDWHAGSELALAITRHQLADDLTKPIDWLWARRVHLFSNQLLRDEVLLCLRQARGYLSLREATAPDRRMMEAIDSYLEDPVRGG
jgi:predicted component of type VI protein secretion system